MVSPRYEGDDTGREDRPEGRLDSREGVLRVARDRVDVARIDRIEDSERVYAGEHVVRSHETGRVPNRGGTFPGPAPVRRRIVPGNAQEHALCADEVSAERKSPVRGDLGEPRRGRGVRRFCHASTTRLSPVAAP